MNSPNKKIISALLDCYQRLYLNSNPPVDFIELRNSCPENEYGEKIIPYLEYTIPQEKFEEIVKQVINDHKIKPKYKAEGFRNGVLMGCSPKFS